MALGTAATLRPSALSQNYPSQIEEILERAFKGLDVVVLNRGVSGEVAEMTARRLKLQVALDRPDLVLWQLGTNDALSRVSVTEFTATVRDAIGWLKEHDIDVVLVGLQYAPKLANDQAFAAIRSSLQDLSQAENVLLVRRFDAMRFIDRINDGHPPTHDDAQANEFGYRCMAEHVARALVVSAFLRAGSPAGQP